MKDKKIIANFGARFLRPYTTYEPIEKEGIIDESEDLKINFSARNLGLILETILPDQKFTTGTTLYLTDPSWSTAKIWEIGSCATYLKGILMA